MKKVLGLVLTAIMSLSLLAGCSSSKPTVPAATPGAAPAETTKTAPAAVKVLKMATANPKARSISQGLMKFAEEVTKETGGAVKVELYTDAVLGDDKRTIEGMQIGSIQGVTASVGAIGGFNKDISAFSLPYLFVDRPTAYKVLDGAVGTELLNGLTKSGFIGLVYMENGIRHLTNNKKEVTTLEDIKGLKIRTLESQIHVDIWRALGANPSPMSFSQLYTALEQKVVDGQENPLGNVLTNKFDEVQKYLTLTGHVYDASPLMISNKFWDTLSDKEKEGVKKAAITARDWQRKAAEQEDIDSTKALTEKGMKISELKAGEKEKMQVALKPVYDKYKTEYSAGLVDKILNAASGK